VLATSQSNRTPSNRYQLLEVDHSPEKEEGSIERDVLIVGDGNFSFTDTLVHRRMNGVGIKTEREESLFPQRVLATEYKSREECCEIPGTENTINCLERLGVEFDFGVDATELNTTYSDRTFSRIQWNCPDLNGGFCDDSPNLRNLIPKFIQASSPLQEEGGRVHISLISPNCNWKTWQAMHYGITSVEGNGYTLHSVKESGSERYKYETKDGVVKQWVHQKTEGDRTIEAFHKGVDELVFEKRDNLDARTPTHYIKKHTGFRKSFDPYGRFWKIQRTDSYYSMGLGEPLSSDSELEESSSPPASKSFALDTLVEADDEIQLD